MNRKVPTPHMGDDQLLDLVHGLGAPEAATDALQHVRACAACEARFRLLAHDRDVLRAAVQPLWVDGEIVLPVAVPTSEHSASGPRRRRAWALPIGTALAAGLAFLVITTERGVTPPRTTPVAPEPIRIERRELTNLRSFDKATATLGTDSFLAAVDACDHQDWARVLVLLHEVPASRFDMVEHLLRACAFYNLQQYDAAIQELTAPGMEVEHWTEPARSDAQHILSNALTALGRSPDTEVLRNALRKRRDGAPAPR